METNKNLVYKFKPFNFTVLSENKEDTMEIPSRNRYCVAYTDAYLITYAGTGRSDAELMKYSFDSHKWKNIKYQGITDTLEYSAIALMDNLIIIYRSFCLSDFNHTLYIGNLTNEKREGGIQFHELGLPTHFPPMTFYQQFVLMESKYLFSINCDFFNNNRIVVSQLELTTQKLEILNSSEHLLDCPQNIILYTNTIYLFGINLFKFHTFNLATKEWEILTANQQDQVPSHSSNRISYSCVQCTENRNLVYVCGGSNRDNTMVLNDVWRFDLNILHWEKINGFTLPRPVYGHSATVTPSGRLCCYSGRYHTSLGNIRGLENSITSAWITIPTLKIMCWEAMIYYFKDQMFESENVMKIGVPREFFNRIIEGR